MTIAPRKLLHSFNQRVLLPQTDLALRQLRCSRVLRAWHYRRLSSSTHLLLKCNPLPLATINLFKINFTIKGISLIFEFLIWIEMHLLQVLPLARYLRVLLRRWRTNLWAHHFILIIYTLFVISHLWRLWKFIRWVERVWVDCWLFHLLGLCSGLVVLHHVFMLFEEVDLLWYLLIFCFWWLDFRLSGLWFEFCWFGWFGDLSTSLLGWPPWAQSGLWHPGQSRRPRPLLLQLRSCSQ